MSHTGLSRRGLMAGGIAAGTAVAAGRIDAAVADRPCLATRYLPPPTSLSLAAQAYLRRGGALPPARPIPAVTDTAG